MIICIVIPNLGPGGAERVASILANQWAETNNQVIIVTFNEEHTPPHYHIRKNINILNIDLPEKLRKSYFRRNLYRIITLRRILSAIKCNVLVSFLTHANVLSIVASKTIKHNAITVISERIHPQFHAIGFVNSLLRRFVYIFTDHVVVQTESIADWMYANFGITSYVIVNPFIMNKYDSSTTNPSKIQRLQYQKNMVSAGRLVEQKNFEELIYAFNIFSKKNLDWGLTIFGEGENRAILEKQILELGLVNRVSLPGVVTNLTEIIADADMFVYSAKYDGFPNVLLEAMYFALPIVATDSHDGSTRNILSTYPYARLSPLGDWKEFADSMNSMKSFTKFPSSVGVYTTDYDPEKISKRWMSLFSKNEKKISKNKILIVTNRLDNGGTERHLLEILPRIVNTGQCVSLYNLSGRGSLIPYFIDADILLNQPSNHFFVTTFFLKGLLGKLFSRTVNFFNLYLFIRRTKPTLIHFYLPESYILGAISSLIARVPLKVMSRRSLNGYQKNYPILALIERYLHSTVDAVLANSRAIVKQLIDEGIDSSKIQLIYNGVDAELNCDDSFRADFFNSLGIKKNTILITIVANLIPYKNHAYLIHSLSIIKDELAKFDWKLLVVGRDDGIGTELEKLSLNLGVRSNVIFLGERKDARCIMSISDIGILCSLEEGFSNAILECMSASLPMIVTDVGGNAEAIVDGKCGFVVPLDDIQTFAGAIKKLFFNERLRKEFGVNARNRVLEKFTVERCVHEYGNFYSDILSYGRYNGRPSK